MTFKSNISLAQYTTFRIGGKARLFADVGNAMELAECYERAQKDSLPVFVFSGGSNIVFSDRGFSGLVIRMTDGGLQVDEKKGRISVGAGRPLGVLVERANKTGLAGLENLAGIPGSVGGAIRGNAGAFGVEIGDSVLSVKAFHSESGMVREFHKEECVFSYRQSFFKTHPEYIIVSAEFRLTPTNHPDRLKEASREIVALREAKHPQEVFCAGSFFMNPIVENEKLHEEFRKDTGKESKSKRLPAGWLIDHVGLRGKMIGHAKVSEAHPNYLINTGGATAEEILTLASIIKQRVRDEAGVMLATEVQLIGFGEAR